MDFMHSFSQQSSYISAPSPEMNRSGNGRDWGMYEEPFEAEESEFVCDGDQEPLQTDRTSELAIESWNLKKTVMDLSTEILKLKSALRTQKNLTKNLQKINASVQQENKDRAKDNVHLRSTVVNLEKQLSDLSQQSAGLTTNVMRQKKVANQLQGKLAESYTHHTQQLKEKDAVIQKLNDQLAQLMEEKRSEKERQENENLFLKNERERLNSSVQVLTRRCEVAERENNHLNEELSKTREHCTDAARFLNSELEKAFESMHTKLERVIAKKDEYRMKIFENENERDQILAFMLSEGLQMPIMAPLNIAQAREKIRIENLSFDEVF